MVFLAPLIAGYMIFDFAVCIEEWFVPVSSAIVCSAVYRAFHTFFCTLTVSSMVSILKVFVILPWFCWLSKGFRPHFWSWDGWCISSRSKLKLHSAYCCLDPYSEKFFLNIRCLKFSLRIFSPGRRFVYPQVRGSGGTTR